VSDKGSLSRKSRPFAVLAILCAAAVLAILTGATSPLSATQFANTGHWVYNSVLGMLFHVDGATLNIDAQLRIDADDGSQVLQSDSSGYVVGRNRITEFDKASQAPGEPVRPPADETALGIEVVGGPYAVYRNAGTIVRLGDPPATISAGGAIGNPVVTDDGTMWFHRTGKGTICRLDKEAVTVSGCPVSAPKDHAGALTIVDGRPAFVDLFSSRLHTINGDTLGAGVPLGVRLSPDSRPAAQDTDGRLAILDPGQNRLVLVDTRTKPAKAVTKSLPRGDYDGPVSTGDVIALVDRQKDVVLTFGADGVKKDEQPIEQKTGQPRLSRGEDDRIYVEDADGTEVLVVGEDGDVRDVDVTEKPVTPTQTPTQAPERPGDTGRPSGPPTGTPRPGTQSPPVSPSRPGAPLAVAARPGDGSVTVTWDAAPDNRASITSYQVTWQGGSRTFGPGARQAVVPATNGVTYVFTVTATNQVGTGPGASTAPVTPSAPFAPAAPPVGLQAVYDQWDQPTRDVTLSWRQPDLRGGTLMHYEIAATGQDTQTVTGTEFTYPQVESNQTITFTVRAITRTPDGQTLTGEPATATHEAAPPGRANLSKGALTTEYCGDEGPDCAWMHVELTGFAPGTDYHVQPFSSVPYENGGHTTRTNDTGFADIDEFAYSGPGDSVWVVVRLGSSGGPVVAESEHITW
jgi:hypothetical protein